MVRLVMLAGSVILLFILSKSRPVDQIISFWIEKGLKKWTNMDLHDYSGLLKLNDGYSVTELKLQKSDWISGRLVKECKLKQEGLHILGIRRKDGSYVGVPDGDTRLYPDDTLILYGPSKDLKRLSRRSKGGAGDIEHQQAVREEEGRMRQQKNEEQLHENKREKEKMNK